MVEITNHAQKRVKERINLTGVAAEKYINKVYEKGKNPEDFTEKPIRKYLNNVLKYSNADTLKVYGNSIYLFLEQHLLTAFNMNNKIIQKANRGKFYESI